jgi:hypothetical protein
MRRTLLNMIVLALFGCPALAQKRLPPVLKVTVDKQKILIGEPIHVMLEATVYGPGPTTWPVLDTLAHFEFVEKHPVDSTPSAGQRYYRQYLTITSFDSGVRSIPRLPFVLGNTTYFTDSVRIEIRYTKIDPSKDYQDIKDIIDVPNPFSRWFVWIIAAITIASAAVVVWLIRKKHLLAAFIPTPSAPRLSPYEEAIQQLDELTKQRLVESGAIKTFYSRLSDILRVYLYRSKGIASLSETSDELIEQMRRKLSLPSQQLTDLAETLRMGDFVKFAKFLPGVSDSEFHYRTIRTTIEELHKPDSPQPNQIQANEIQPNQDQPTN